MLVSRTRISFASLLFLALTGCAGVGQSEQQADSAANTPPSKSGGSRDPVTLTFFSQGNSAVLAEKIGELVSKKFPHIKLNTIVGGGSVNIENTVASGQLPDLISYSLGGIEGLKKAQMLSDLTPLIKKHGFDLTRLAAGVDVAVRHYSNNDGQFILMPFELNNNALFYNKTIFDKFGVSYPKDGMTWESLYDLAKQVTRMDGGVQYKGFRYEEQNMVFKNQLGGSFVDPGTHKAVVNNDLWKRWLNVMTAFYAIPGNELDTKISEKDEFIKKQTLAMRTGPNFMSELPAAVGNGFDWDVVSLPEFEGLQGKGSQLNAPYYGIPPTSKHKDEAFEVIAYLMSDEVQATMARLGRLPIVREEKVKSEFGAGDEGLKGKNLQAFYKDTVAKPSPTTIYDSLAKVSLVKKGIRGMAIERKDVNTVLRETDEDINIQIEAAKAGK
jgi:multiple sugar transport system substrate-binding protein